MFHNLGGRRKSCQTSWSCYDQNFDNVHSLKLHPALLIKVRLLGLMFGTKTLTYSPPSGLLCPSRCVAGLSGQPGGWRERTEQRADPPDPQRPVPGLPGHCRPLPSGVAPGSQVCRNKEVAKLNVIDRLFLASIFSEVKIDFCSVLLASH